MIKNKPYVIATFLGIVDSSAFIELPSGLLVKCELTEGQLARAKFDLQKRDRSFYVTPIGLHKNYPSPWLRYNFTTKRLVINCDHDWCNLMMCDEHYVDLDTMSIG